MPSLPCFLAALVAAASPASVPVAPPVLQASGMRIEMTARPEALWTVRPAPNAPPQAIAPPVFPLDGRLVTALPVRFERVGEPVPLGPDVLEHRFRGVLRDDGALALEVRFRLSDLSPIVRFQYRLTSTSRHAFSRRGREDELVFLRAGLELLPRATEVRLSEWVEPLGYTLLERPVAQREFDAGSGVVGPILLGSDGRRTLLLAYEHGSPASNAFLRFDLRPGRGVTLRAVKGSTGRGQPLDAEHPYETIWLQLGLVAGDEARAAESYRRFVREDLAQDGASRQPFVSYDARSGGRRRSDDAGGRDPIDAALALDEIDAAHRMGVEVFVLDGDRSRETAERTVSRRYREGLDAVRKKLEAYGMRLGLSIDPVAVAPSSTAYAAHRAHTMSWSGRPTPGSGRSTGESATMCLVSPWGEAFVDELVRLHRETGVTFFEWAAVGQSGCDAPGHGHGTLADAPGERAAAYAFRIGPRLAELAERLAERVPGAVVDFDVSGRDGPLGLALLRAGRCRVDAPQARERGVPGDPGQGRALVEEARTRITRSTYGYDRWIPSELVVTHYSPDGPETAQKANLAALILGHDGIRGELAAVSPPGQALFARVLGLWGQVRDSIAAASPVRAEAAGGGFEVHEKVDGRGRGAIVLFSTHGGVEHYVSERTVVPEHWGTSGVQISSDAAGHAVLDAHFDGPGTAIVFFGAREQARTSSR